MIHDESTALLKAFYGDHGSKPAILPIEQWLAMFAKYVIATRQPQPVTERLLTRNEIDSLSTDGLTEYGPQQYREVVARAQDAKTATFFEQRIAELEAALNTAMIVPYP